MVRFSSRSDGAIIGRPFKAGISCFHIVFSTKGRRPFIKPAIEERVWKYIAGIACGHKMNPIQIGGVEDHVHVLLGSPPILAPSKIVQLLKGGSSAWIHEEFSDMRAFEWQAGYAAFSVSKSQIADVTAYIQNQREHHRNRSFKAEYLALLRKHEVPYDERCVFD